MSETATDEMIDEKLEEKVMEATKGEPLAMSELAMALAFIGMNKLSREQQNDIISAALAAHRVMVVEHFCALLTNQYKDMEANTIMQRLAESMLLTEERKKSIVTRFFTLASMVRD